jgi:long-chain acyl-CoA synthetase
MKTACNIVDVIRSETAECRLRTAVVDGDIALSYDGLLKAVDRVAKTLAAQGVKPLDRVAFLGEDSADYVIGCLAILRCGAVVVPVSPSLMGDELERVMDRMDVRYLIYDQASTRRDEGLPLDADGFCVRTMGLVSRNVRDDFPSEYARLNPAFIRFSSGTTGDSKGVLLSHETIVARTDAANQGLNVTSADIVIWVLSMSFHFVVTILLFLRRGATIVICRQPFPESFLETARQRRATLFYASPFHYHVLATSALVPADCLQQVRLAVSTSTKLTPETADVFERKFGIPLVEAYGIIELGLPFINTDRVKRGSVGKALPDYEVRIARPDGEGIGAIQIRGKGLFDAYVSPWQSRDAVMSEGWFDTGDVGCLDEEGYLTIRGRKKNVINFAGMKIFPYDVEAILNGHQDISESLVYGEAHPLFGHIPCARIVLKPGATVDIGDLRRYCFQRMVPHKVPKLFTVVESIARTRSGKIKRE